MMHNRKFKRPIVVIVMIAGAAAGSGCVWFEESPKKLSLGVDPQVGALANSAAYKGTIGAYSYYEGLRPMSVRGYGLVVGLGKNGSRDCPRRIYEQLIQTLYKRHKFSSNIVGEESITPEEMIEDLDTAVVVVQGNIPPSAVAGSRFDVAVSVIPGTQTKSLYGGRLYGTELRVFTPVSATALLTGKVLARAAGPLFLNPFSEEGAATRSTTLEATVLGGGLVSVNRRIRLVLLEPSYRVARRIQDRINAQFSGPKRTANATSPSFVQLRIPNEFRRDTGHFLGLVRALYLSRDPRTDALHARQLANEMKLEDAPYAQIVLAFEGLGRAALPEVESLYVQERDATSFYAAAAGLRLGDHVAGDAMVIHAQDPQCTSRFPAIRALGRARGMGGTTMALRQLLHDPDARVRIAAYEQLVMRGDSSIRTIRIGGDNFFLDLVPTASTGCIYAKRRGERRVALFGSNIQLRPPIFYRAPDDSVTIIAGEEDDHLTLLRVVASTGSSSGPIKATFSLEQLIRLMGSDADVDLDGKVLGLGVDYTVVVNALNRLAADGALDAKFILERANTEGMLGPRRAASRPETEIKRERNK